MANTPDGLPEFTVPPPLPPVYRAGDEREPAALEWLGQRVEIRIRQAGSTARSDQVLALIDGEWRLTNKSAVARELVKLVHRQASKALASQWERSLIQA